MSHPANAIVIQLRESCRLFFFRPGPKLDLRFGVQVLASHMEGKMEMYGVPVAPEAQGGGAGPDTRLDLGAWFGRGWNGAAAIGEKGMDFVSNVLDRFREADGLGYDNEGDQNDN
jgi:hypothetical protein